MTNQESRKEKTRTPSSAIGHVLLVYPRDKQENSRSVDTRLVQAISPNNLKLEVKGRKLVSTGGVLVCLITKIDVEVLERVIKDNETLKDTDQVTVPKLRNPRILELPNDFKRADVNKEA